MAQLAANLFANHPQGLPIVIGGDAAHRVSVNDFFAQHVKLADIEQLGRLVVEHRADPAECFPLFAAIGSKPTGAFASLAALYADVHGRAKEPGRSCTLVMRDLLLLGVDRRLQTIYRQFFSSLQPMPGATHDQKIAALEATRHDVLAVLKSYDWRWFADWLDIGSVGDTAESCVRRLGNLAFSLNSVTFLFTRHCNISCRHCYNDSGPHKKAVRIPLDRMLAVVAQMPAVGIRRLNITGGEPFLYQQDVLAMVKAGRAAGVDTISINTNGFWASTDERANQMLDRLVQAGFMQGTGDIIKVSAGVYHAEFLAFDHALTLARNYHDRFGKSLIIDFELTPQAEAAAVKEVRDRVSAAGLSERAALQFRSVHAVGRAKELTEIEHGPGPLRCHAIGDVVITPDETVVPCAGLNYENNGIIIGRSDRHRLKDLIKRMQNDPILQFVAATKWDDLFSLLGKQKRQAGYSGRCDLCLHAIGDLNDKTQLQAALFAQQKFYPFWFKLAGREPAIDDLAS